VSNETYRISRRSFLVKAAIGIAAFSSGSLLNRASAAAATWDSTMELLVNLEINQPDGGRYNRPYVAVWIEDAAGKSVRTLALWADAGRGSRWIPDLTRWFGANSALVSTVSSATRNPGQYSLAWDGKNDKKASVTQGDYFVCIEAAREHGSYQLIRQKVTIGTKAFTATLPGNLEIKGASLDYHQRK
jgi:hypothetical protein